MSKPTTAPEDQKHLMIDIEALGLKPGCAVIELAAQYFNPHTATTGPALHLRLIAQTPFHIDPDTLAWHKDKGTYPPAEGASAMPPIPPVTALFLFGKFLQQHGEPHVYWSWGSTYDFPILEAVYSQYNQSPPWHYWQTRCARTVFKTLLPHSEATPKPHDASKDVAAQIHDLTRSLIILR